jgi:D-sedoheptulose 7-phosphate isomerase
VTDIGGYLASSAAVAAALAERPGAAAVERAARLVADALAGGGQVLFCGNGGSAADAQHLAAELMGRLLLERPAYRAVALTTDTSVLTAVGNDYGYADVFARQVEGPLRERPAGGGQGEGQGHGRGRLPRPGRLAP